jgi:hypothetical protein
MSFTTATEDTAAPPQYIPFVESDPQATVEELRHEMETRSYLFFRGLLPAEVVLQVRHDILELCREAGWLDPASDLMDAVVAPNVQPTTEGKPDYMAVYRRVLKLPSFREFPSHPLLMDMARRILDGEVLVHPRRIGRMTFPNNVVATVPAHQDFFYIRGAIDTYTCWAPLGDCPIQLGGLAVWPGSHRRGFQEHTARHAGAVGGHGIPVDEAQAEWHTTDYQAGDALFFHSYSVHKGLPNLSGNRLRLSTDNRYQLKAADIDPSSLLPHFNLD